MKKVQSLFNSKSYDMFFVIGEHWGAIVIGDGMRGLAAAAHWVKAGLRVLALERTPPLMKIFVMAGRKSL